MLKFEICRSGSPEGQTDMKLGESKDKLECTSTHWNPPAHRLEPMPVLSASDLDGVGVFEEKLAPFAKGPNIHLAQESMKLKEDPWECKPTSVTWTQDHRCELQSALLALQNKTQNGYSLTTSLQISLLPFKSLREISLVDLET